MTDPKTAANGGMAGWRRYLHGVFTRLLEQRWTNVGLRAKMGLLVEIGLLGLISIFLFLGVSTARQATQKILSERMMLARLSAATLDSTLRQVQSVLVLLSDQSSIRSSDASLAERQSALEDAYHQISHTSQYLFYFDSSGGLIASASRKEKALSQAELGALWGAIADKHNSLVPRLITLPGEPFLSTNIAAIIAPVSDQALQPPGILVAVLDLAGAEFSPLRDTIDLGKTGKLDVVDSEGRVLISSHPEQDATSDSLERVRSKLFIEGKPVVETCLGCGGEDLFESTDEVIAFAPLDQAPWGVVVRQKASELMSPVNRLLVQTLLLGAVTVIGALGLVWVTTNSVIRPVQTLKEAAERIAEGDLSTPIEIPSQSWIYGRGRRRDEIGDLAQGFAAMRRKLKRSIDEINDLNRELDARVHERTQAALQAQLEAQAARDDLRAIIDALSDELTVVNVDDLSILLANRAVQEQHGELGELIGQECVQVCHRSQPCISPDCECPLPLVVKTGSPVRVTHELPCPNDSEKKIFKEISASPMRDADGRINRVVELVRDVTEEQELEESLVRRNQQLSILNAIAMTVNQSLNLEDILSRSLEAVLKLTGIDVGAIFLQEDLQGELKLMAYSGLSQEAALYAAEMGMMDGSCGGVLEHGQIVIVPDLKRFHYSRARSLLRENLSTLVHVPLIAKGCVLGSMCVGTRRQRDFGDEEQELLTAIGNQIAVGIENARLYAEVQMKERMRGELFLKAINAQEDERKRIARELHDDTSQSLAALLYAVEESLEMKGVSQIYRRLEGMHDLVQHTLDGVHKLIFDLRPSMLDHLGLVPAIRSFAESRLKPKGVRLTVEDNSPNSRLPAEVETALFRIVQEAVMNIARHAAARNVWIKLIIAEDDVLIDVEDDGVGFAVVDLTPELDSLRGLGLLGMQERLELLGGDLEVQSTPGSGTRLFIRVPTNNGIHQNE